MLTEVGRERPALAEAVTAFRSTRTSARAALEVIEVPNGTHGFDFRDHTDESRQAATSALDSVVGRLQT